MSDVKSLETLLEKIVNLQKDVHSTMEKLEPDKKNIESDDEKEDFEKNYCYECYNGEFILVENPISYDEDYEVAMKNAGFVSTPIITVPNDDNIQHTLMVYQQDVGAVEMEYMFFAELVFGEMLEFIFFKNHVQLLNFLNNYGKTLKNIC